MDKDKIIDEILDFVEQYTEVYDVELKILNKQVNIEIEVLDNNFNYINVARMLSKILKTKYENYKFVVNMSPINSKITPLFKEYGMRSELMKKIHGISFDDAFVEFVDKRVNDNFNIEDIFFKRALKNSIINEDEYLTEKEVCNDYIDFLNEAYVLIEEAKLSEAMVRFNLFRLYGSKLLRMGSPFIIKLWRFNYDRIILNMNIKFSNIIADKEKFSNFVNSLKLEHVKNPLSQSEKNSKIAYYSIPQEIFVELLVGGASYLEAIASSRVQKLILLDPSKFYNYFLKRFGALFGDEKLDMFYYLSLAGAIVKDELEFDQIKGSPLGRFKINRSEVKVKYTGNYKTYLKALDRAYARIKKKKGE